MEVLQNLKWRYATKQFNPNKKLSTEQLETVLNAINLAPTSYGLQPFQVLVIEDTEHRLKLKEAAFGQPQVTDSSQVIVFAAINNLSGKYVDDFVSRISSTTGAPLESLAEYGNQMKGKIGKMSEEQALTWASKQCYIGLGFLLSTCAQLQIDACPMEGFMPKEFDEILGLKEKNLNSVVMATVGFRSEDDKYQHHAKVRKELETLIVKY